MLCADFFRGGEISAAFGEGLAETAGFELEWKVGSYGPAALAAAALQRSI